MSSSVQMQEKVSARDWQKFFLLGTLWGGSFLFSGLVRRRKRKEYDFFSNAFIFVKQKKVRSVRVCAHEKIITQCASFSTVCVNFFFYFRVD